MQAYVKVEPTNIDCPNPTPIGDSAPEPKNEMFLNLVGLRLP
jgi:hypothetical protein